MFIVLGTNVCLSRSAIFKQRILSVTLTLSLCFYSLWCFITLVYRSMNGPQHNRINGVYGFTSSVHVVFLVLKNILLMWWKRRKKFEQDIILLTGAEITEPRFRRTHNITTPYNITTTLQHHRVNHTSVTIITQTHIKKVQSQNKHKSQSNHT